MTRMAISLFVLLLTPVAGAQSAAWVINKLEWTAADEAAYSRFVQRLGEAKCFTVSECMRSTANPYRDTDPVDTKFWSDCADWPYFLRAYYSWKNGLPFGYVSSIGSHDVEDRKLNPPVLAPGEVLKPIDMRTSSLGNYPRARYSIVTGQRRMNFVLEVNRMQNTISSGMLRIAFGNPSKVANDFYSADIRVGSIRPGTVIYDPAGHVAVVYKVLPDGRILYFDAHPDNSITHGRYDGKFVRSRPAQGAGFKNFRPIRLVGAKLSRNGLEYVGGKVVPMADHEIADASVTQFYGTVPDAEKWSKGVFVHKGKTVDYYEYVRASLATENINPVVEFEGALQELCDDFKERRESIEVATAKQFHLRPHPGLIPANLFSSLGDWESYSTPGRDTRMRASFAGLQKALNERYSQYLRDDYSDMKYTGKDLKADFLRAFHNVNYNCPVSYTNSAGKVINLSFELGLRRLYRMSFDPYHCPEKRWGATSSQELATCPDDNVKHDWYVGEQRIRNFLQRDWSARADLTLETLQLVGSDQVVDLDVKGWLQSLPPKGM